MFTCAASFGNVHGVYKAGNVKLSPEILGKAQAYIKEKTGSKEDKPVFFVFHGGSGSEKDKIKEALNHGVIKFNIDTDIQWATWDGIREFEAEKHDYLQGQIGNPDGPEKPNKKYYDPRMWSRAAEESTRDRLLSAYEDLNAMDALSK
jgi:fructose-bisphosphate aldolase class II